MLAVHRAFRREFALLPRMVRSVRAGDSVRAAVIAAHARDLLAALEHHHDGEDALIWPRLRASGEVPQALMYLMETQHEALTDLLALTRQSLTRWAPTAAASHRDQLTLVLDNLHLALDEHLEDEERSLLPIAARMLTPAEWTQVGAREVEPLPKARQLARLGALLETATAAEQADILRSVSRSTRVGYFLIGARRYERRCAQLRRDLAEAPVRT
jgi:hemerythrin-like domain-containing protein